MAIVFDWLSTQRYRAVRLTKRENFERTQYKIHAAGLQTRNDNIGNAVVQRPASYPQKS
jgi:hypothetical protein